MAKPWPLTSSKSTLPTSSTEPPTDPASGLPKRPSIYRTFDRAKSLARTAEFPLAFALFRINALHAVAALHGSEMHDRMVRQIAHSLRTTFEQSDLCVRWSTDEFAALEPTHPEKIPYETVQVRTGVIDLVKVLALGRSQLTHDTVEQVLDRP